MRRVVCSLLLMSGFLAAEEAPPYSLVDYLKSPIPRAAGSVNVISGDWVDQESHCQTSGPDPYVVAHSYCSTNTEEGTLADGWDFFHPSELEVHQPEGITYNEKSPKPVFDCKNPHSYLDQVLPRGEAWRPPTNLEGCLWSNAMPRRKDGPNKSGDFCNQTLAAVPLAEAPQMATEPPLTDDDPSSIRPLIGLEKRHHRKRHYKDRPDPATLFYREAGGSTVIFESACIKRGFHPKLENVGYSVVSSIDQPIRRSAERTHVNWNSSNDTWVVELGDGTKRTYSRVDKNRHRLCVYDKGYYKRRYHIHEERLPSGNERRFHYDADKELSRIDTLSSDKRFLISSVDFHRYKDHVDVVSSDGLTTRFHFKKLHDRDTARVVETIDRPGLSRLHYKYSSKDTFSRRVHVRTTAGRPDIPDYFHEEKGSRAAVFSAGKIRRVRTKDFSGHPLATSHSFSYAQSSKRDKARVREADGSSTNYSWWRTKLPHQVKTWDPQGTLLRRERFEWDGPRLKHRVILDAGKRPILDREYLYDDRNNVVCERLHGLFTGRITTSPSYNAKGKLVPTEYLTRKATYDNLSRKTGEVDPLNNWIFYKYEPDRDLLTARFTCNQETIVRREFFQYNSAAVCVQSSVDDGTSQDPNDMTGVTRRTTRKITARSALPRFGAPEEVWTYIWTPDGGERLLSLERFTRNGQGLAVQKELFDTNLIVQKRWSYAYDQYGRITMTCNPDGSVENISYDESGRIASKTTPEATTVFSYDLLDRLIEEKKIYPDGSSDSVCYQYDLTGRVCTKIDGRGRTTTTAKDLVGRCIRTELPAIATEAGVIRPCTQTRYDDLAEYHTSPTGVVTTIVRSATGKPFSSHTPDKGSTIYFYDALCRLVEQHEPSGLIAYTSYDTLNRVTRVQKIADGITVSDVITTYRGFDPVEDRYQTKVVSYSYDEWGRRSSETITDNLTGQSIVTRTEYDSLHRPVRIVHETVGTEERITYDVMDREVERQVLGSDEALLSITTKAYDLAGRTIEEGIGRNGTIAKTRTVYGAFGLPASITYPDGTKTAFEYNPLYRWADGRTYFRKAVRDARGVMTEQLLDSNDQARCTMVFDPFGTIISKREVLFSVLGQPARIDDAVIAQGQLSSTITTQLCYNGNGQCTSCTLAANTADTATWTYLYDGFGRKVVEAKPSGLALSYSYDQQGKLLTLRSSDNTISWDYSYNDQTLPKAITDNVANAVTQRVYNGLGAVLSETLQTSLTTGFELLPTGLLSSITYPDGSQSRYSYASGRLSSISRNGHTYTVNSRDLSGLITDAMLPDSCGHVTAALDIMGRRTLISHPSFSEERTLFDPVGCLLERSIDGQTEVFGYDFLCQLTNDNGRSALYDSLHNRVETEGMAAVHNSLHQILAQGALRYAYDLDGRRISDDAYRYTYDALDRLIRAENASVRYDYSYDPFNRRLSTTTFSSAQDGWEQVSFERYLWQQDCEIGSIDERGNIISLRVLGEGLGAEIGSAVLFELNGTTYVPLHDLSGHVRVLFTSDGQEAERLTYTAYKLESRSSNITPWTFSSKRQDPTGFVYFGQRYYDPQTATWMTLDPLGNSAGPNLYAYVKNNPLTYFDLYGLFGESFGEAASGFASAVCDFFGAVFNTVCDIFSGFANAFSGGPGGGETDWSAESAERIEHALSCAKESSHPAQVLKNTEAQSQVALSSRKTPEEFVEEHRGQKLGKYALVALFVGSGTTLEGALAMADKIMSMDKRAKEVLVPYCATDGVILDIPKAGANALGFVFKDGITTKSGFINFLTLCQKAGIEFEMRFVSFSRGVANCYNILHSPEFLENPNIGRYCGDMLNLGGPITVPNSMNCFALGDPISMLALVNLPAVANAAWKGELSFVCPKSLEFPHNFYGSSYQEALQKFLTRE